MVQFNRETGKQITQVAPDALNFLFNYDYPGNVRELENMIERAFVICPGQTLLMKHFQIAPRRAEKRDGTLASQERNLIIKTLNETEWNYLKAARALGISRSTLWRRLKEFKIRPK